MQNTELHSSRGPVGISYDSEVQIIKQKIGGLEDVRSRLGLSRRRICQLLLVDPSAWSRWTRPGVDAPPHIYRALEWYLLNLEKHPDFLRESEAFSRLSKVETEIRGRAKRDRLVWALLAVSLCLGVARFFLAQN